METRKWAFFYGRRPISRKMSRPWNHELGWSWCTFGYCHLQDPDDLPFQRGEVLTLVRKDEEKWWTVKNQYGRTGLVPVPYIDQVILVYLIMSVTAC